jgi:hypothetical protein
MKQIVLIIISAFLLSGCFEEKQLFEQAVLKQLQADKDMKDYALDSDEMMNCVVDTTSNDMPGMFSFEPQRQPIYLGYAKLLNLKSANKPEAELQELKEIFGSGKAVAAAQRNYSESVFECFQSLVSKTDPGV